VIRRSRVFGPLAAALGFSALFSFAAANQDLASNEKARWSDDQILIQLRDSPVAGSSVMARARSGKDWVRQLGLPDTVELQGMGRSANRDELSSRPLELDRPIVIRLNRALSVTQAVELLRKRSDVVFAEPDFISRLGSQPNDPSYSMQWHHQQIQSEGAWAITTGSNDVIVAEIDSGLAPGLYDVNGRVLPIKDYVNHRSDFYDDTGHGTEITGIIAATGNNGQYVAGLDWNCRILPLKTYDAQGTSLYSRLTQAVYDATDSGAKVINLSGGGDSFSSALLNAINYAVAHNVIFVTITHNNGAEAITFPGDQAVSITVGGTLPGDARAKFSNYGSAVDLVAPATSVYTISKTGGVIGGSGTSVSAPQVSGVAALIASIWPSINQRQMEQLLSATAEDNRGDPDDTPGWDQYFGYGRLNARYAVEAALHHSSPAQTSNLATRLQVLPGDNAMIGGFIITGAHAKNVLIRALGPSLAGAGVSGPLQNPSLELHDSSGEVVVLNDNWKDWQRIDIEASGISPADDREAAIMQILQPGAYTAVVRGDPGGVALLEVYDLQATPNSRLANLSTRGFVDLGDNVMIGGFIVGAPSNYVVRAMGPSLATAGVSNPLPDPILELHDGNGAVLKTNDDWQTDANAGQVQAAGLAPSNAKESALYLNLGAGNYTAIVRGTHDSTGIGLVEVYNVP
jgi:hypothetical protein